MRTSNEMSGGTVRRTVAQVHAYWRAKESRANNPPSRRSHCGGKASLKAMLAGCESRSLENGDREHTGTHDGIAFRYVYRTEESARIARLARATVSFDALMDKWTALVKAAGHVDLAIDPWELSAQLDAARAEVAKHQSAPLATRERYDACPDMSYQVKPGEIRALSAAGREWFAACARNARGGWRTSAAIAAADARAREARDSSPSAKPVVKPTPAAPRCKPCMIVAPHLSSLDGADLPRSPACRRGWPTFGTPSPMSLARCPKGRPPDAATLDASATPPDQSRCEPA